MSSVGAAFSDVFPDLTDPNPILDVGCSQSVGGIVSAAALATAMDIEFVIEPSDRDPFYHGYGPACRDKKLVFALWKLPVVDFYGNKAVKFLSTSQKEMGLFFWGMKLSLLLICLVKRTFL